MAKIIIDPFTGTKHLPGSGLCSTVTACGTVDCFSRDGRIIKEGIETEGFPDCPGCLDVARVIFESITKKEVMCYEKNREFVRRQNAP